MSRIYQSGEGGLKYSFPHTGMQIAIEGAVDQPRAGSTAGTIAYFPIVSTKGPTGKLLKFTNEDAYADFIKTMGTGTIKQNGMPYWALEDHLRSGGKAVVLNLRAEDASLANAILAATFTPVAKSFFVDDNGAVYSVRPDTNVTPTTEITINTYQLAPIYTNIENARVSEEVDLAAMDLKDTAVDSCIIPVMSTSYVGVGQYGNNFEILIEKTSKIIGGNNTYTLLVYDRKSKVAVDKFTVTFARDIYENAVPVSAEDVLKTFAKGLDTTYYSDIVDEFDDVFIDMLTNLETQIQAQYDGGVTVLENLLTSIGDLKAVYEGDLADVPALDLFDLFNSSNNDIIEVLFKTPDVDVFRIALKNGSDGALAKMKRFDFDFKATIDGIEKNVLVELYEKAFNGFISEDIFSYSDLPTDIIYDIDYPVIVKQAISDLIKRRPDVVGLSSYPTNIRSYEEAQAYRNTFNPDNQNMFYFLESFEKINIRDAKPYRIGVPQALIPELATFYEDSFAPVAGRLIPGVIEDTVMPKVTSAAQKQWLFDNNVNYMSLIKKGYMLDGAQANMIDIVHPYKELHNQLIVGRIIKELLDILTEKRHLFDNDNEISKINEDINNYVLQKYRSKVDITYKLFYNSEYDKKVGTLTNIVTINGPRTIQRHNVIFKMVNN